MRILGIDPGKDGYLALLVDGYYAGAWPTPTLRIAKGSKRDYERAAMRELLVVANPGHVFMEKQQAMPKQGVTSTLATGQGFGLWEGIVVGLGMPYSIVAARTWQKVMFAGITGDMPKAKSIVAAQRLFPHVDLRKTPRSHVAHDGKADALLLAEYGRRLLKRT